ncbi:MAG TPA: reverse transcriptase family protein [Candidatus Bathyarchaeia archaeon]|nr:reverse transcriptase family protein [Candidatus Bathyarchaeia archaeon]HLP49015.1 reverse transcriptase family protein [Candidatus Kapabacteria bacterium]
MNNFLQKIGISNKDAKYLFSVADTLYAPKEIPKKDGCKRMLFVPNKELKNCQKSVLKELSSLLRLPGYVHGGVKGKSIITNAKIHCNQQYVLALDIKDFFPSVKVKRIEKSFSENFKFSTQLLKWMVRIVSFKYCLPQGAPTSPFVANLAVQKMDSRIYSLCQKSGVTYSRYFDDITISGGDEAKNIFRSQKIQKIISNEGFKTSHKKTRLQHRSAKQRVTGLIVNDGLAIDENTIDEIKESIKNREFLTSVKELESLRGKISFVKSVDRKKGNELENFYKMQVAQ